MIRTLAEQDLDTVMKLWLDTNRKAHHFIPAEYWEGHYAGVKNALPEAEVYVYEDETGEIEGFIGLIEGFVAGLFVREGVQSRGIGKQLLDYAKSRRNALRLTVYQRNSRAVRFYEREGFAIRTKTTDAGTGEKEFEMLWKR